MQTHSALGRVRLAGVDGPPRPRVRLQRGRATSSVDIGAGDDRFTAVAAATLEALARLLPPVVSFSVDQVSVVPFERPVAVVVVVITVAGTPLHHTGSALVGDDPELAVAKATLAAVNRRVEILGI